LEAGDVRSACCVTDTTNRPAASDHPEEVNVTMPRCLTGAALFVLQGADLVVPGSIDPATTFDLQGTGGPDSLTLTGMTGAASFDAAISDLQAYDQIVLNGVSFAPGDTAEYDGVADTLTILQGTTAVFTFSHLSTRVGSPTTFNVGTNSGQVACFAVGTLIETISGPRPVECLSVGDEVRTVLGKSKAPIVWIGRRHVDCVRHSNPKQVSPVRVRAGAFGDNAPRHDLWLSPDHSVFVDGVLIPIRYLTNGTTIAQMPVDEVTYYHIELDQHGVLLAEGLLPESYLDTGDRRKFSNGGGVLSLFPDFSSRSSDTAAIWEAFGCAPLIISGLALGAVRHRVNARALTLDWRISSAPGFRADGL
jgi:hypothetical protein